jgi:hypothetical protein
MCCPFPLTPTSIHYRTLNSRCPQGGVRQNAVRRTLSQESPVEVGNFTIPRRQPLLTRRRAIWYKMPPILADCRLRPGAHRRDDAPTTESYEGVVRMKTLCLCLLLSLSLTAYAQQPGVGPTGTAPNRTQPDLSGERLRQLVHAADEMDRAGQQAQAAGLRQQAEQERQSLLKHVVNLRAEIERIERLVGNRQQVIVHLKVMEVSLTKLEAMGFDMTKFLGNAAAAPEDPKKVGAPGTFSVIDDTNDTRQLLEALRKDNLAKVLAEPTLVTLNGQEAVFRSGGQVAIPKPQKDGSSAADYQFYGTEVQLKPEVLLDHSVRLAVRCGVSELDYANPTHVGKDVIPGIRSRDVNTTAKIANGRTLVLAGFVQSRVDAEMSGVPVVSELPYAGALFRKVKEHRTKTATFVLITPELVEPLDENAKAGGAAAATPPAPTDVNVRR